MGATVEHMGYGEPYNTNTFMCIYMTRATSRRTLFGSTRVHRMCLGWRGDWGGAAWRGSHLSCVQCQRPELYTLYYRAIACSRQGTVLHST